MILTVVLLDQNDQKFKKAHKKFYPSLSGKSQESYSFNMFICGNSQLSLQFKSKILQKPGGLCIFHVMFLALFFGSQS